MSFFWVLIALMTGGVLIALLWPLLRKRGNAELRADYDLKVYKDQLKEIERDQNRGLLSSDQAQAAKTEIERRMLSAGEDRVRQEKHLKQAYPTISHGVAMGTTGLVIALAIGYYFETGSPGLPDQPLASRNLPASHETAAAPHSEGATLEEQMQSMDMAVALQRLQDRLEEDPQNIEGWLMLGRSYIAMDRYVDAANAYKKGLDLTGGKNPVLAADYAELLMSLSGNTFTEDSIKWFEIALREDPMNAKARFYLAAKRAKDGDIRGALQDWVDLKALSPPDAPWMPAVQYQMDRASEDLGIDLATMEPTTEAKMLAQANPERLQPLSPDTPPETVETANAAPGPSAEDMAAAAEMSDSEREQMIQGMVERLAAKLEENPDDLAGWQRLARAYQVLGETEKAAEAQAQVRRLQQTQQAATPAPGPSAEDMAAASQMSDRERQQMIQGMVDRLAQKLEENPDDLAGWQRLARAYEVLGETEKAELANAEVRRLEGR